MWKEIIILCLILIFPLLWSSLKQYFERRSISQVQTSHLEHVQDQPQWSFVHSGGKNLRSVELWVDTTRLGLQDSITVQICEAPPSPEDVIYPTLYEYTVDRRTPSRCRILLTPQLKYITKKMYCFNDVFLVHTKSNTTCALPILVNFMFSGSFTTST